jgi:hypothetical protein
MLKVAGPVGPTPAVVVTVKVTVAAPCGTGVGNWSFAVSSSGVSNPTVPSGVEPAAAATVPLHPVLPVPQLSWSDTLWSASGRRAVVVIVSSDGNSLPVGALSPFGSKQPSNS